MSVPSIFYVASAALVFVNGLAIDGSMGDTYGNSANDGRLGFFSDIYYDTNRNEWWGLSDRGPGGGTIPYETRVQRFSLGIDQNTGAISNFQIHNTLKFSLNGNPLNGLAPTTTSQLGNSFDPEGIVINPRNGNLLVSDEYGPSLYEIDRKGTSALVAINDHEFMVIERNNRGLGIDATLATADKEVYKIDLTNATDVTNIDLDSGTPYTPVTKSTTFIDPVGTLFI